MDNKAYVLGGLAGLATLVIGYKALHGKKKEQVMNLGEIRSIN